MRFDMPALHRRIFYLSDDSVEMRLLMDVGSCLNKRIPYIKTYMY